MERRIFLLLSLLFLTMGIYAQEADEIHLKGLPLFLPAGSASLCAG